MPSHATRGRFAPLPGRNSTRTAGLALWWLPLVAKHTPLKKSLASGAIGRGRRVDRAWVIQRRGHGARRGRRETIWLRGSDWSSDIFGGCAAGVRSAPVRPIPGRRPNKICSANSARRSANSALKADVAPARAEPFRDKAVGQRIFDPKLALKFRTNTVSVHPNKAAESRSKFARRMPEPPWTGHGHESVTCRCPPIVAQAGTELALYRRGRETHP
jgi:hypothetical protein